MRGQLSVEFVIIISGLLVILAVVTMPMYNQARADAEKVSKLADAHEAANTLVNAINLVYAAGVGSQQTVEYWLPPGVVSVSFVDGTENRVDIKIELDQESDNVMQVSTILSSTYENMVSGSILISSNYRVLHRTTLRHDYDIGYAQPMRVVLSDEIIESV
ncbi:MAG: class III signal peptide-containing protein [Hadesarchaea archaeon]|nr:MAG: class III signal peptide-containing protein [Hadesarchaea archaeon]